MTTTARRRWSRELESQVDGVAIGRSGPVVLHGYEPPAGGKWIDSVIPGQLSALDRNSGDTLWRVPCEVGYGRGFGAGIGANGKVLVLGPGSSGHLIARMHLANGELDSAAEIAAFDEALVGDDVCVCLNAPRVFAIDSKGLKESWVYATEGERYHHVRRVDDLVLVVFSRRDSGRQGILRLDAETGSFEGILVEPQLPVIHDLAATAGTAVALTCGLSYALPDERLEKLHGELAANGGGERDTLSLIALPVDGEPRTDPHWFRVLDTRPMDELPEASIQADSGKLYLERGALLEAVDALTGRALGNWTVPGLDERLSWCVVDGAGLLAEETRVSLFELPA